MLVGTSGFMLDVLCLYLLTEYGHMWYVLSEVLATFITFLTNYIFNTIWTYRDAMKALDAKTVNAPVSVKTHALVAHQDELDGKK